MIDTVLGKDKDFLQWRAEHPESFVPRGQDRLLLVAAHPLAGRPGIHWAMNLLQRIVVVPQVRRGKPCVRGTRMSVDDVLGYLAGGMSQDEVLQDFPQRERDDIRACLAFAAERERLILRVPTA